MTIKNKMVAAAALVFGLLLPSVARAANLVEFRDSVNNFSVYITTPANQLVGAGLDASSLNTGTVPNARLDSASVTLQGNTFNTANKLVQLDGTTKLPAVDGSQLTNVTASIIGANSVGTTQIIDSTITASDLGTDSVGSDEIQADAVGSSEIATDAVGSAEIAADAVGSSEIAADAVGSSEIATDAVGPSELQATAVTAASYGSATQVGAFTVDADGRLTAASNVTVTPAAASVAAGTFSGSFTFSSALTVSGLDMRGALSAASLRTTACAAHATVPCMAYNTTDFDLYTSTNAATGSWRNTRTGVAP